MYFAFVPILVLAMYMARRKGTQLNFRGNKHLAESQINSQPTVGIRNLGHTCYMNAVIQGLYAIESYRNRVLSSSFIDQSVGFEVKRLFEALRDGNLSCADAALLADALQIDIFVQQDSEELFLTLVNGVDDSLATNVSPYPSQAVKFHTRQSVTCKNVQSSKEKIQHNLDLSVNINGHSTLHSAIQSHFQRELLQNDPISGVNNQYHTKEFGLQDAVKTLHLVDTAYLRPQVVEKRSTKGTNLLPEALVVHLKRFAFDPLTQRMHKLRDPVDIPLLLDLNNVTIGIFKRAESGEDRVAQLAQGIEEKELSTFKGTVYSTTKDAKYELTAVVIHVGTLESGHYYCLKRVKNDTQIASSASSKRSATPSASKDRWVMCNDEQVLDISEEEALAQAKGKIHPFDPSVSSNAYMLFYTRVSDKK